MNLDFTRPNLHPREASFYLSQVWGIERKPSTLAKMRCTRSDGPIFIKAGRAVLYLKTGLDEYARQILSRPRHSTSDIGAQS